MHSILRNIKLDHALTRPKPPRSTLVPAAVAVALACGCGEAGFEDDLESELPGASEDSGLSATENDQAPDPLSTSEDKSRLPTCDRTDEVRQAFPSYFVAPAAQAPKGIFCVLREGDRGPGVAMLNASLSSCYGNNTIPNNDQFNEATKGAIQWIQQEAGITMDGVYGPQTFTVMKWLRWKRNTQGAQGCTRFGE